MASKMAEKLYGDSPKLEREEGGKMSVKKKSKETKEKEGKAAETEDQGSGEAVPEAGPRHAMERMQMNARHEHEHYMDKGGDKKVMHERHEKEMKEMHARHEKEMTGPEKE